VKRIGTAMIVKNESAVIRRCLESLVPMVDYFLIVDTGSADGTQRVIRDFLSEHGLAGDVVDEPWKDFAHNRTSALTRLRANREIDYALIIDADDELVLEDGFDPKQFKAEMDRDLYDVVIQYGANRYHRPQILRNSAAFFYRGVLHEFVEGPPEGFSRADAAGFHIRIRGGGARSQDHAKFARDAETLERALDTESDPLLVSRYTFYLAQSYRDCGQKQKALDNYLKRSTQGFWIEEVFVSLYEAAKLRTALGHPADQVIATFLAASAAVPARAEALHGTSRYCRGIGRFDEALELARKGLERPQPPTGLFIETWIYDYGLADEAAIAAFHTGAHRESLDACLRMLAGGKLPASEVQRVAANASRAASAIDAPAEKARAPRRQRDFEGSSTSSYGRWSVHPPRTAPNAGIDRAAIQRLLQEIGTGLLFGGDSTAAIERLISSGAPAAEARRIIESAVADPLIVNGREMAFMLRRRDWLLQSLERLQSLSSRAKKLERRGDLSGGEFLELFYARNRPVIMEGELEAWPARAKWTLPFFEEAFKVLPGGSGAVVARDQKSVEIAMEDAAFAMFADDIRRLPKFLDETMPPRGGKALILQAGAFTPLSYDPRNKLMAQISGRAQLKLAAAGAVSKVYNRRGFESEVADLDALGPEGAARFPLIARLKVHTIDLDPGEIAFVPMAWWHQYRAIDPGICVHLVNFRWPNDMDEAYPSTPDGQA
jgi:tetratricopeptide (TPR) repeat protein